VLLALGHVSLGVLPMVLGEGLLLLGDGHPVEELTTDSHVFACVLVMSMGQRTEVAANVVVVGGGSNRFALDVIASGLAAPAEGRDLVRVALGLSNVGVEEVFLVEADLGFGGRGGVGDDGVGSVRSVGHLVRVLQIMAQNIVQGIRLLGCRGRGQVLLDLVSLVQQAVQVGSAEAGGVMGGGSHGRLVLRRLSEGSAVLGRASEEASMLRLGVLDCVALGSMSVGSQPVLELTNSIRQLGNLPVLLLDLLFQGFVVVIGIGVGRAVAMASSLEWFKGMRVPLRLRKRGAVAILLDCRGSRVRGSSEASLVGRMNIVGSVQEHVELTGEEVARELGFNSESIGLVSESPDEGEVDSSFHL